MPPPLVESRHEWLLVEGGRAVMLAMSRAWPGCRAGAEWAGTLRKIVWLELPRPFRSVDSVHRQDPDMADAGGLWMRQKRHY